MRAVAGTVLILALALASCGEVTDPNSGNGGPDGGDDNGGGQNKPDGGGPDVDHTAPATRIDDAPPDPSNTLQPTFAFSAGEDEVVFNCQVDAEPSFGCESPLTITLASEGLHTFTVVATDAAGNVDPIGATYQWVVDVTPPEVAINSGPSDPSGEPMATFAFSTTEEATFACAVDGAAPFACDSPATVSELAEGDHVFEVTATDAAGNSATAEHAWTVDTDVPSLEILSGPPAQTNQTNATVTFAAEAGTTVTCALDTGAFGACTTGTSVTYTGLAANVGHTVHVRATDGAGNFATARYEWFIDTIAPELALLERPDAVTADTAAAFTFEAEAGATVACRLDGGSFEACASATSASYAGLAGDADHTFTVRATDAAGNQATASHTWTIDSTGPTVTITSGPSGTTADTSATLAFTASEAGSTFECRLDGGAWASCTSPRSYGSLGDGAHTFSVRATDAVGNTGAAATRSWTIDASGPTVSITSGPSGLVASADAAFQFTAEAGSTFECRLDSGAWAGCSSPRSYAGLAQGDHTFRVRATDGLGNTGAEASRSWTVDTVGPTVSITSGPSGTVASTSGSFSFSSEAGATFECRLDTGAWGSCSSPRAYSSLAQGAHTFRVRATDAVGNTGAEATRGWTVDTVAPSVSITSGPSGLTASTSASFGFSSEAGAAFECQLDTGAWASCSSPRAYSSLAQGAHTFRVRATDGAGNTGAEATRTWTVDTVGPAVTITSGPSGTVASSSASFAFTSEASASFECRVDSGAWGSCTSPAAYIEIADGGHTFRVRATDTAGNTGAEATRSWTVDTVGPTATLLTGPTGTVASTSATFTFSAEAGATFQCRLNKGLWGACDSPRSYSSLSQGTHIFRVRAIDALGNIGPEVTRSWTVDTVLPTITITSRPESPTYLSSATVGFTVTDATAVTVTCSIDGGAYSSCTSPKTWTGLAPMTHVGRIRAVDAAGNTRTVSVVWDQINIP